jgi:hypothetical protein
MSLASKRTVSTKKCTFSCHYGNTKPVKKSEIGLNMADGPICGGHSSAIEVAGPEDSIYEVKSVSHSTNALIAQKSKLKLFSKTNFFIKNCVVL